MIHNLMSLFFPCRLGMLMMMLPNGPGSTPLLTS